MQTLNSKEFIEYKRKLEEKSKMSTENEVSTTESTVTKPSKKLSNIEFKYGTLVTNNELVYVMKLSAKVVENKSSTFGQFGSIFGAGGESSEATSEETINTVLLANVKPDGKVETVEVTEKAQLFKWLTNDKDAKFEIPTYLTEQLRDMVGKDMSNFKGSLKEFYPISGEEQLNLLKESVIVKEAISEFEQMAVELKTAVVAAKKSGGNIGLDHFIDRYAFNNHIMLAGPRGVKSFCDTIAA